MTNNTSPSMYRQLAALDRERHATLKIGQATDMLFASGLLLVPLVTSEFADVAREYPIMFVPDAEQKLMPVAVTGVPGGKNLYIDAKGKWNANYIPAYVRRHPFIFAKTGPDQLTVCVDENCAWLGNEGTPLFEAGAPTPFLQQIIDGLSEYERQAQYTLSFVQRLQASGVLMEATARAELNGKNLAIDGLLMVDEPRLRALPDATIKEWFASGELGLVYAHLISLGNLLELLRRQSRDADAAANSSGS